MAIERVWILLILVYSAMTHAQSNPTQSLEPSSSIPVYVVGYFPMAPFAEPNSSGPPTGLFAELMAETLQRSGYLWRFQEYPPARYYKAMVDGEFQIQFIPKGVTDLESAMIRNPEPVFELTIELSWKAGSQAVKSLEELTGKTMLIILGFNYGGLLEELKTNYPKIELIQAPDYEAAARMLAAGRASYMLSYQLTNLVLAEKVGIDSLLRLPVGKVSYHFGIHATVPSNGEILSHLQKTYKAMEQEGKVDLIFKKYFIVP